MNSDDAKTSLALSILRFNGMSDREVEIYIAGYADAAEVIADKAQVIISELQLECIRIISNRPLDDL
jgi:hypothetical protein